MLTQFEVDMICRAVEALRSIAKELTRIRSLMETKSPEPPSEGKEDRK